MTTRLSINDHPHLTGSWYTNRERLHLVRLFHKLGCNIEALEILDPLQASLGVMAESGNNDRQLLIDADEFRQVIVSQP